MLNININNKPVEFVLFQACSFYFYYTNILDKTSASMIELRSISNIWIIQTPQPHQKHIDQKNHTCRETWKQHSCNQIITSSLLNWTKRKNKPVPFQNFQIKDKKTEKAKKKNFQARDLHRNTKLIIKFQATAPTTVDEQPHYTAKPLAKTSTKGRSQQNGRWHQTGNKKGTAATPNFFEEKE